MTAEKLIELSDGNEVPESTYNDPVKLGQFIGNYLVGSAKNEPDEVMDIDGVAEALDEVALWCTACGWWFEPEETTISEHGELVCTDCDRDGN